jgi:hypothetical protein
MLKDRRTRLSGVRVRTCTAMADSIDRMLVEGQRYRVRLDAKDPVGREARFRGKVER